MFINIYISGDINVWMLDSIINVCRHFTSNFQTFLNQKANIWICLGNVYGCKGRVLGLAVCSSIRILGYNFQANIQHSGQATVSSSQAELGLQ